MTLLHYHKFVRMRPLKVILFRLLVWFERIDVLRSFTNDVFVDRQGAFPFLLRRFKFELL